MNAVLPTDDIAFLQRLLRADGLYTAHVSGKWDSDTESAVTKFDRRAAALRAELGAFDPCSETNIASLALRAQREARGMLRRLHDTGFNRRIVSGTRTYAEQNE